MAHTWDFHNDKKRVWQCFVCGHEHHDFASFKDHIVHQHEEGREYVVCPLERCGAPVRDLKSHFKSKHPHDKLPAAKQHKAIVWSDAKEIKKGKGKKVKKPRIRTGSFTSHKNNKEIPYRSGMECEVYECLEAMNEVAAFEAEPVKIKYLFNGQMHHYTPDIQVQYKDGHIEIWEVKPACQTQLPQNDAKWNAANIYCQSRNWSFMVLTEVGLGRLRKQIRLQWALQRGESVPEEPLPVLLDE